MICIGVVGDDEGFQTIGILMRLFKKEGINALFINNPLKNKKLHALMKEIEKKKPDFIIFNILDDCTGLDNFKFKIMVYLKGEKTTDLPINLCTKNILIANCDEKSIFPFSVGIGTALITSGVNNKATVTASSILEEAENTKVQTCIQRNITTLSESEIEPQEFSFEVKSPVDASYILAAVTIAIVCDINVENIKIN